MKRHKIDPMDGKTAEPLKHDLNRLLSLVHAGSGLSLPSQLTLPSLNFPKVMPRQCVVGELNQIWRYGGVLEKPTDLEAEELLEAIQRWIAKELQ